VDDDPSRGLARPRFVHTDVISAYSPAASPSTPDDYVRALLRHYPQGPDSEEEPRPALAIADYGLHSAVKTTVACDRAGIDHIVGLRVRVVPQRTYRTWGERVGELILLAIDESGWLSLVGLNNRGFLLGADRGRPRVDMRDLEDFSKGVIALTGMPGGGGILSSARRLPRSHRLVMLGSSPRRRATSTCFRRCRTLISRMRIASSNDSGSNTLGG
jgi:DNA polymerase III alpha subunit